MSIEALSLKTRTGTDMTFTPADSPTPAPAAPDPLKDPALRGPGLWRSLRESFCGTRRLLDVAQVEVTSLCPGACVYCPHSTMSAVWEGRHMAPETFARLWPLLLQTERVHLQGWGEPLLHPRFLDMVALARRAECRVSTTSCGLIMNEKLAAALVDSGLDVMAFSITGVSPESNTLFRKGVDFARLLNSIRLLQAVRREKMGVHLEIHFACLLPASRVGEIGDLPDLMAELGVHAAVVSTLDYIPAPEWKAEAFFPDEREKIAEARHELEKAAHKARALGLALHYALPEPKARPTCLERPDRSVYIDAEGNLSPCIYVNLPTRCHDPLRRVFGNCREADALNIWQGPEFQAFIKALAGAEPDAPCRDCPKRFAVGNRHLPG